MPEIGPDLKLIGTSAAGHRFKGTVKRGEAVRIFTGAPVPKGADAVIIQENVDAKAGASVCREPVRAGQNVRGRGLDFTSGRGTDPGRHPAQRPRPRPRRRHELRNRPCAEETARGGVRHRRRTGGARRQAQCRPDRLVQQSTALAALAGHFGADVTDLGIVKDDLKATIAPSRRRRGADILITTGGASVGDHDYVQEALKAAA